MDKDEIIHMAREAGLGSERWTTDEQFHAFIERFASLVATHEREVCASLRKEIPLVGLVNNEYESGFWNALEMYQKAIRARGEK